MPDIWQNEKFDVPCPLQDVPVTYFIFITQILRLNKFERPDQISIWKQKLLFLCTLRTVPWPSVNILGKNL